MKKPAVLNLDGCDVFELYLPAGTAAQFQQVNIKTSLPSRFSNALLGLPRL
jgi:hypothetical protein